MQPVHTLGPWLAVGDRAEQALLACDVSQYGTGSSGGMAARGGLERPGTLQATGAMLDAVQRRQSPRIVRVADPFTALGWLARGDAHGCVVAAETIADRPYEALQALRVRLRDAPLFLLDADTLPAVRHAAQAADVPLFSESDAATVLGSRMHPVLRVGPDIPPSAADSIPPVALSPEGLSPEGLSPEGLSPEGLSPDGPSPDVLSAEGLSPPTSPQHDATPRDERASFSDGCLEYLRDPEALSRFVVEQIRALSHARRITLMLRDPERPTLSLEAGRGVKAALVGKVRCSMGSGIAGRVAALGRPVVGRGSTGGSRDYTGTTYAVLPLGTGDACEGVICLTGLPDDDVPNAATVARWSALTRRAGLALAAARRLARAQAESTHDALTRLPNRRAFERALSRELERAERSGRGLAVAIFDIDHFKRCNDEFGHEAGDRALVEVAQRLREALRETDLVARWGGEEFAILLPDLERDAPTEAETVAGRARTRVAARPVALGPGLPSMAITVSGGVARYPQHGRTAAALVRLADGALYEAKRTGRNRIEAATSKP